MADQLDMNGLSLQDSQHAPNGFGGARSAYIPPHARRSGGGPAPAAPGGMDGSAWGPQKYVILSSDLIPLADHLKRFWGTQRWTQWWSQRGISNGRQ